MKKIVLFLGMFLLTSVSHAYWETLRENSSSFTMTNEGPIAIATGSLQGGILVGVVVSSANAGGGTLKLWNAMNPGGVAISTIGIINIGQITTTSPAPFFIPFDVRVSSGITYQTTGNTNGVTIIYKITKPSLLGF